MIDTTQLTNLISAFRVEKESISPETVGSLLQNITDLLANASSSTEQQAIEARQKYVTAFNQTRIKIWQEQITLLDVIDTGALLASPKAFPVRADGRFFEVGLSQAFLEYGLWQDYGTGRETPRKSSAEGELAHTSAEAQPGLRSRNASWKLRRSRPCQNFSCKPNAESSSLEL